MYKFKKNTRHTDQFNKVHYQKSNSFEKRSGQVNTGS